MSKIKKEKIGKYFLAFALVFIGVLLSCFFISAASSFSSGSTSVVQTQYFSPSITSSFGGSYSSYLSTSSRETTPSTGAMFDMEIIVPPLGCKPYVVRSDLLEEQNVPVFCQLVPIKINPGLDITRIESINVKQQQSNPYVSGVGFYPARAAIKSKSTLTSAPTGENLGYAIIVLKQQATEKDMPDVVNLTLSAVLQYGASYAFGIGETQYYLPAITDSEFENNYHDYSFFNGMGYLRVEDLDEKGATISLYTLNGRANSGFTKVFSQRIELGKVSRDFYLPSASGGQGIRISLKDITLPQTSARIRVNGQTFDVYDGESFFNGKCSVRNLQSTGGQTGSARIYCSGKSFDLIKQFSSIDLIAKGIQKQYNIGDKIEGLSTGNADYYLAYMGDVPYSDPREYYIFVTNISNSQAASLGSNGIKQRIIEINKKIESNLPNKTSSNYKEQIKTLTKVNLGIFGGDSVSLIPILSGEKSSVIDLQFYNVKGLNRPLLPGVEDYLGRALTSYDSVKDSYGAENYFINPSQTYGEASLWAQYDLAIYLGQSAKANEILSRISNDYPDSRNNGLSARDYLSKNNLLSNDGSTAYHDKEDMFIELVFINEPAFADSSVQLTSFIDGNMSSANVRKGQLITDSSNVSKTISVKSFSEDKVYFNYSCVDNKGDIRRGEATAEKNKDAIIQECNARIVVNQINFKQIAKVQITPIVSGRSRETNFSVAITIEKRPETFQLTPEEANKKIAELNKQIAAWRNVTDLLAKGIKIEKGLCLATSAYVNLKNLLSGAGGEASARREVMKRWNEKCASVQFQKDSNAADAEECIANNYKDKIEPEITATQSAMKGYNTLYSSLNNQFKNDTKVKEGILTNLTSMTGNINAKVNCRPDPNDPTNAPKQICSDLNGKNISAILNDKSLSQVTYSELSEIYFQIQMSQNPGLSKESQQQYQESAYNKLEQIRLRTENSVQVATLSAKFNGAHVDSFGGDKTQEVTTTLDSWSLISSRINGVPDGVSDGTKVKIYNYASKGNYLAVLDPISGRTYGIKKLYKLNERTDGKYDFVESSDKEVLNFKFIEGDPQSYKNVCKNCNEMKAFVLEPYKGMPALLPFDAEEGWYVQTKQVTAGLLSGNVKTFQDSGRVNSFWLCNVGKNGLIEGTGINDDICRRFDFYTGDTLDSFPGLTKDLAKRKVSEALRAIEQAQSQLTSNPTKITITQPSGRPLTLKVKGSEGDIGSKCTDFMSPGDCQLLFNVCDPVVCPNSRCDFGGTYPVDNVIQSGIVGSTLLCLPNSIFLHPNTGVVIPVCLTGIHAGIDALTQVLENYRDCLNESATTGKVVGVCDMIYSVYMCDFFWRQVGPFSENLIKDIFLKVFGAGDKGGGEYLFVQDAWTNAEKSAQFMQSTYGSNSKLAFGFKDLTQTAVSEVCKAPFSATYPDKFDTMLEPESPVQFYASFSEIPYTDASVPPTSQYSVSYFIYSGNDQGHYYQIYLKSGPTALGYVGKDSAVVASGYVNQGEKVSFKKDLLEVSGFKELCVKIDVQEKCGFKSVSTSMALNYAKDYTTGSQAGSNISTESECIAGSASAGSLLTPNLQSAAEGLANPAIYNQGIIRVCSSGNPGAGTPDQSRWNYVGYCDDRTIGCWIDTKSVENAITGRGLENETLSAIAALNLDYLTSQGGYFTKEVGRAKINDLKVVYNNLLTQIKQDPASVENAIYSGTLIDFGNTSYNGRKFVGFSDDIKSLSAKLIYNDQKAELAIYQAYVYDQIARKIGKNVTLGSVSSSSSSGTSTNSANASANANNSVASVGGISSQDKVDIANEQGFWTTVSDKILSDDVLSLACALSPNPADSIVSGTGRATGAGAIAVTSQAAANVAEVTSLSPVMVQSGNYVIQSGVAQRLAIFNSGGISYVKDLTGNIIGQVGTGGKIISPSGKVIKGLSLAANAKYVDAAGNVITQTGSLVANGKGALKLVTPTSKAFTAISRISNALLLYELACKCLQTEQAFFSAWDSTQEFQLASAETDSQVTTRIINFNKQINLINQSMDDLEYYIKQIEDVSLQDKLISEYDSLKQQFDTIVNLNRKLRDTYNVYRTNDEKKSSRFFTLVAGSEFSDSEYSYLKDLMKALRVRLVDAGKLVESMNTKINDVTSSVSVSSSAGVSSGTIFVPDSFKNQVSSSNLVSSKGSYSISESVIPADRTMINAVTSGGLVNIPDTSKLAKRYFNLTFILDNSYDYNSIDSVVKNFLINKYGQFWKSDSNLQIFAKKIVLDSNYNKWDVYVTYYGNTDFLQNDAFDQLMQAGEQMIAQVNLFLGDAQTTLNSCTNTLSGYTSKVSCPVYNSAKVDVDIQEIKNILILAEKATTSSDQLKYANDALSKTQILKTYLVSNGAESSLVSQIDGIIVSLQQEIVKIQ